MKKMFIVVFSVVAMVGCSNEKSVVEPTTDDQVAVRLSAGVNTSTINSRAVINPGDAFGAQFISSALASNYATTLWDTEADIAVSGAVTLTVPQYYPIDGSSIYMKGFAPAATVTNGNVEYTITGNEDVMVTGEVSGDKRSSALNFTFDHLLTQLKFKVIAADANFPSGVTVKDVRVTNTQTAVSLNLNSGVLTFSGGVKSLDVFTGGNYAINATGVLINELLLVEPGKTQILLDVVINNGADITHSAIPVALTTVAGSSHLITLTFKNTAVTANAVVAPWTTGAEGGADIN